MITKKEKEIRAYIIEVEKREKARIKRDVETYLSTGKFAKLRGYKELSRLALKNINPFTL